MSAISQQNKELLRHFITGSVEAGTFGFTDRGLEALMNACRVAGVRKVEREVREMLDATPGKGWDEAFRVISSEDRCLIQTEGWYWRPDSQGYTKDPDAAGVYTGAGALAITGNLGREKQARIAVLR